MWFLKGKFSNCGQKVSASLWKLHTTCAEKSSDSKQFFKRMFLLETKFGDRAKAFRTCGVAFFGNSSKLLFFLSMAMLKIYTHFLTKVYGPILFFDCGQKMFDLLAKKFRQGGQNFIPLAQRNLRGNDVFGRKISSYHFCSLSWKFFNVFENFIFWSPLNFSGKIFFVFEFPNHYCRNLKKNLRTFRTKTSPVCQISIVHLNLFSWRKNNLGNGKIVCFSYFKQKGITDLGRNIFEFSLNNDIEKNSAGLFLCCFFVETFRILKQKFSVFWHEVFSSRSELH